VAEGKKAGSQYCEVEGEGGDLPFFRTAPPKGHRLQVANPLSGPRCKEKFYAFHPTMGLVLATEAQFRPMAIGWVHVILIFGMVLALPSRAYTNTQ
jgi:hypothetical protein